MARAHNASSPERWRHLEALFAEARLLPPAERLPFLDIACATDDALRRDLDRLLAAHDRAGGFLDAFDTTRAAALLTDHEAFNEEQIIGPYRVVGEIGRGGMGTVHLAERTDGQFEQRVALKLIKRGMDSEAILRRFLDERQILARLHHPHIARLYDGGITADGRPYFAMEYVDGVPITQYCDDRKLDVEARLRLFQDVCRAVQYAHQNLIVHRDLKPSNMMVTEDGQLKLLDFGIAKLLDEDGKTGPTTQTAAGHRMMTPEYAAPEQVLGTAITTATDVYALGVVLYVLLTGHRPYRLEGRTPEALHLSQIEPERPSTAVSRTEKILHTDGTTETITPDVIARERGMSLDRLQRRLAGDLDMMVLMALRREPERRYASAEAFLEDIKRHLAGLPVQAHRDTLRYRASKFIRRHKVSVAAALAFVVLAVAAAGFAVAMAVQQARTARETAKTEEVKDFVLSLFEASNPLEEAKGDTITARALLERGIARVEKELHEQPEIQAEMLAVLGNIYIVLARYDRAAPLLERSLALRRDVLGDDHPEVAQSLYDLASMKRRQGDYDGAEPLYRQALALRQQLFGEENTDVADSKNGLAAVLYQKGAYDEAEPLYREALAMKRKLLGEEHEDVASLLNNLAMLLRNKSNYDAAEPLMREALAMKRKLLGEEHLYVANSLGGLATLLERKGDYAAAESLYRNVLAIRRKLLGEQHPAVLTSLNNLALLVQKKGDYNEAVSLHRETLAMHRKLLGNEHPDVAQSLHNLGVALAQKGNYDEAELLHREALAMRRKLLGETHTETAWTLAWLGRLLLDQNRSAEAEPVLQEALQILDQALPENHWQRAEVQSLLGACLSALGGFEEAEPLLLNGYNGLKASQGRQRETQRARQYLVAHFERRGLPEQAAAYHVSDPFP